MTTADEIAVGPSEVAAQVDRVAQRLQFCRQGKASRSSHSAGKAEYLAFRRRNARSNPEEMVAPGVLVTGAPTTPPRRHHPVRQDGSRRAGKEGYPDAGWPASLNEHPWLVTPDRLKPVRKGHAPKAVKVSAATAPIGRSRGRSRRTRRPTRRAMDRPLRQATAPGRAPPSPGRVRSAAIPIGPRCGRRRW